MTERPNWDATWMAVAEVISRRSHCIRAQVGSVIVSPSNRIVATGYNGPPAGLDVPDHGDCRTFCGRGKSKLNVDLSPHYDDCVTVHAEVNAIAFCDRTTREDGTLYVTGPICFSCSKIVANCGVRRVVFSSDERYAYRRPDEGIKFLINCGVKVDRWAP